MLPAATRTEIWSRAGADPSQVPPMMEVGDLVDAALAGFDQREPVTIPPLHDGDHWTAYQNARLVMAAPGSRTARAPPTARRPRPYRAPTARRASPPKITSRPATAGDWSDKRHEGLHSRQVRQDRAASPSARFPEPKLQDDDILVEIHAAALNLLDSKIRDGEFEPILSYRPPFVLGHDVAGQGCSGRGEGPRLQGGRRDLCASARRPDRDLRRIHRDQRSRRRAQAQRPSAWKKPPRSRWWG
ncbi:alcohol dehydrogenase catalytic domain-containing protein [Caulobacter segnis]